MRRVKNCDLNDSEDTDSLQGDQLQRLHNIIWVLRVLTRCQKLYHMKRALIF